MESVSEKSFLRILNCLPKEAPLVFIPKEKFKYFALIALSNTTSANETGLYIAFTNKRIFILDVHFTFKKPSRKGKSSEHKDSVTLRGIKEQITYESIAPHHGGLVCINPRHPFKFYLVIHNPHGPHRQLHLESCYRRDIVQKMQIAFNTYMIAEHGDFTELKIKNSGLTHPTVAFFSRLPPCMVKNKGFFVRRGYVFLADKKFTDIYQNRPNRQVGYYDFIDPEEEKPPPQKDRKCLHLRVMEPTPISYSSLLSARDELFLGDKKKQQLSSSDLDFQLWTEASARSVALQEVSAYIIQDYHIETKGHYNKKLNVVGDKSLWIGFELHIFTEQREIGVLGVRRKYLPPNVEYNQDFLFVLYGPRCNKQSGGSGGNASLQEVLQPDFMEELRAMVDSFSPLVTPAPFSEGGGGKCIPHSTYFDQGVIQARLNSLLFPVPLYAYLQTMNNMSAETATGLVPTSTGQGTFGPADLAKIFVHSLHRCNLGSHQDKGEEQKDDRGGAADSEGSSMLSEVDNPLSLIFRMEAEMPHNTSNLGVYSFKEEQKARISAYFAYCTDDGLQPGVVNLRALCDSVMSNQMDENQLVVNKVIDFLLYIKRRGPVEIPSVLNTEDAIERPYSESIHSFLANAARNPHPPFGGLGPAGSDLDNPYEFTNVENVMIKLRDPAIMSGFTCNEEVLLALLQTPYFETLDRNERQAGEASLMPQFLAQLLTWIHNTDLIRCVCHKITTFRRIEGDVSILVPPLLNIVSVTGNILTKTYAFQALKTLSARGYHSAIFQQGGVGLAMWHIYVSKSSELIEACVDLLLSAVGRTANPVEEPAFLKLTQEAFPVQLANLLESRFGLENCRYPPSLLGKVCSLILKMSAHTETLNSFLDQDVMSEMLYMVKKFHYYDSILLQVTACVGTLYVNAGKRLYSLFARPEEEKTDKKKQSQVDKFAQISEDDHAIVLVQTLKEYMMKQRVLLLLNILIAVRYLVRTDHCPKQERERRHVLLAILYADYTFESLLDACKSEAVKSKDSAQKSKISIEELRNKEIIANSLINKVKWFKKQKKEIASVVEAAQNRKH
mmetsp:Transcript_29830/g.58419  ORF Transcript_29830/g.58419 Transcript_29830/m.58419 type:complete len:1067 (-) Transcript_29830:121-3321(-)